MASGKLKKVASAPERPVKSRKALGAEMEHKKARANRKTTRNQIAAPASFKKAVTGFSAFRPSGTVAPTVHGGPSLGLRVKNTPALIEEIVQGLAMQSFIHLAEALAIPQEELATRVHISTRTLARRKKEGRLQPDESDRIARLSMLLDKTVELFEGDPKRAAYWFKTPKKALAGSSPLEFSATEPGAQEVRDLIGRLEDGVFS